MKLVDILARELDEWPDLAEIAVQDDDGVVKFTEVNRLSKLDGTWVRLGAHAFDKLVDVDTAEDCDTATVTRVQWQEARDALTSRKHSNLDNPPVGATHYIKCSEGIVDWWMREPGNNWYVWAWTAKHWALDTPSAGQKNLMKPIHESLQKKEWDGSDLPPVGTVCEAFDAERELWWHGQVLLHGNTDHAFASGTPECWGTLFWASKFRPIRTPEQIAAEEIASISQEIKMLPVSTWDGVAEYLHSKGYRTSNGNKKA